MKMAEEWFTLSQIILRQIYCQRVDEREVSKDLLNQLCSLNDHMFDNIYKITKFKKVVDEARTLVVFVYAYH